MSEKLSCSTRFNQLLKFKSQEVFFSQIILLLVIPEANSKIKQLRKACGCWGMQSKEKFPSSHTPIRLIAFCSTAIMERERNRPVKKCKLREDQSIIIIIIINYYYYYYLIFVHVIHHQSILAWMPWTLMQNGR